MSGSVPLPHSAALDILRRAPALEVASLDDSGLPLLRTLHGVIVDGAPCFHGGPRGAKGNLDGRPAVVSAHETIASLPSYFSDPRRACPATTWYRSVQARGTLESVESGPERARILGALMRRFQPEGGYEPIAADHPLYRNAVKGLLILRLRTESVVGRMKIGGNRRPAQRSELLERLWRRGAAGDATAIVEVRHLDPETPPPPSLVCDDLEACPDPRVLGPDVEQQTTALLATQYWNRGVPREVLAAAHRGSDAWVVLRDPSGRVVATGRGISDGAKHAWVYDVAVHEDRRGRGVGAALLRVLLDHPALRTAARVHLSTRDAEGFYSRLGFGPSDTVCAVPWVRRRLTLDRGRSAAAGTSNSSTSAGSSPAR